MPHSSRALTVSAVLIAAIMAGYVLYAARDLFVPFVIAVFVWYVINAMVHSVQRLRLNDRSPPYWLALVVIMLLIVAVIYITVTLIGRNVNAVAAAAPLYAENLKRMAGVIFAWFGLAEPPALRAAVQHIEIGPWIGQLAGALANLAGNMGLIFIYVLFLLAAQTNSRRKLVVLFPDPRRRDRVMGMIRRIQAEIESYILLKTVASILTGLVSYVVLILVGVDFASFWAFVIFLLNYIPTIGSILGVAFPAAIALVQFGEPGPFLMVALGLGSIQFIIGNVLEPKMQEARLGLDPLVLVLTLMAWGMMWGVAGMFLSVPLMVITMIVLSNFETTRPIAVLLSKDGTLT